MQETSWLDEELLASQEGSCLTQQITKLLYFKQHKLKDAIWITSQFCNITPHGTTSLCWCFEGMCCLHLQKSGRHEPADNTPLWNTLNATLWLQKLHTVSVPATAPSVWLSPAARGVCQDSAAASQACGCSHWQSVLAACWCPPDVCATCHIAFWTLSCGCISGRRKMPTTHEIIPHYSWRWVHLPL
jgi:hypothetical protein